MMTRQDYDEMLGQLQRLKCGATIMQLVGCFVVGFCTGLVLGMLLASAI